MPIYEKKRVMDGCQVVVTGKSDGRTDIRIFPTEAEADAWISAQIGSDGIATRSGRISPQG